MSKSILRLWLVFSLILAASAVLLLTDRELPRRVGVVGGVPGVAR